MFFIKSVISCSYQEQLTTIVGPAQEPEPELLRNLTLGEYSRGQASLSAEQTSELVEHLRSMEETLTTADERSLRGVLLAASGSGA